MSNYWTVIKIEGYCLFGMREMREYINMKTGESTTVEVDEPTSDVKPAYCPFDGIPRYICLERGCEHFVYCEHDEFERG